MGFFKSKYEKDLDKIIADIDMNMNNNYKDNAQESLHRFEDRLKEMLAQNLLKGKSADYYKGRLEEYEQKMKGYTHKDQLKNWG